NLKKYNFNYQSLGEHDNSYGIDMGIFYPFEQFNIYFVSRNISAAKINFLTFKSSSLGISFYPFKSTQINIDYGIEEENKDEFIFSQESQIFSKLYLRYGLQSNSHKYGIGVGTKFEFWSLDYGLLSHQTLDQTHAFTISIAF
ncbi:MAG: hypothetical protein HY934_09595, partial [Candidatus Firestonebacteria bacterium]|nr:hypothetical protein [Candidatus Firestonebacteria bacterium]